MTNEYNVYGRQTKLIDINAGTTQYVYNVFGELASETNANGFTHTMTYDLLGRVTQRTGPEGTTTNEYYPSGTAAVNNLKKTTGFAYTLDNYYYNSLGQLTSKASTIDGATHTTLYTYNTYGDVASTVYPSGFGVNYTYDANGFLVNIKNAANTVMLFTNNGMNGLGQYTSYSLGNGKTSQNSYYLGIPTRYQTVGVQDLLLTWDYASGNLLSRFDGQKNKTELFAYDNLDRLTSATVSGLSPIAMTYATNGNIQTKTAVGTYTYSDSKINAVTGVTSEAVHSTNAEQIINYTPYQQPYAINEGTYGLYYYYGADYDRVKSEFGTVGGSVTNTRYYFGGGYEKDITGTSTKHIHYINSGKGLVAIVVRENGTDQYYYAYTDHQGSILTMTNSAGVMVAEQNFDAWGRKRNPTTWAYTNVPAIPVWLYRGYTGHEYLPQFGLINMNGRLYDPLLARMLSPDNNVASAGSTQSYNRYSYVGNNPLATIDTNGEDPVTVAIVIGAVIGAYSGGVAANNGQMNPVQWNYNSGRTWGYMVGGAVIGGTSGYLGFGIATSGMPMATTASIVMASYTNSVGMAVLTDGRVSVGVSFGVASFNLDNEDLNYLGEKGNKWYQNVGYVFGGMANVSDIFALFGTAGNATLHADGMNRKVDESADLLSHSEVTTSNGNAHISVGPTKAGGLGKTLNPFRGQTGRPWGSHVGEQGTWSVEISNVNTSILSKISQNIASGHGDLGVGKLKWSLLSFSCVSHTSRALLAAGVLHIPLNLHPYVLNLQMVVRQMGIYASPYLTGMP